MKLLNTQTRYGWPAIFLHWGMALLIIGLFTLGLYMTELTYYDPWYKKAPDLHRSLGVIVAVLLILRTFWRVFTPYPIIETRQKQWEIRLAGLIHKAFYLLIAVLVISGYLISTADGRSIDVFNWFSIPAFVTSIERMEDYAGSVHFSVAVFTMSLVAIHALAALKHHFIGKNRTLLRILGLPQ